MRQFNQIFLTILKADFLLLMATLISLVNHGSLFGKRLKLIVHGIIITTQKLIYVFSDTISNIVHMIVLIMKNG